MKHLASFVVACALASALAQVQAQEPLRITVRASELGLAPLGEKDFTVLFDAVDDRTFEIQLVLTYNPNIFAVQSAIGCAARKVARARGFSKLVLAPSPGSANGGLLGLLHEHDDVAITLGPSFAGREVLTVEGDLKVCDDFRR